MKKLKTYSLLALLFLFTGCSWQEYFILTNSSESSIMLSYTISKVDGFAIFDETPSIYQMNNSGEIDWEKRIIIDDKDSSALSFHYTLPANSILILGNLSNDHYTSHNQYYINGRVFNFRMMEIKKKDGIVTIPASQFDRFFKKKNGYINYEVK